MYGVDIPRFQAEAETIAKLVHPHIVRLLDFDFQDGTPYLVLDYAPQGSLAVRHPYGQKVPLEIVISYLQQIAQALQFAHDQHVIHRDLKPDNILIGRQDELLLSDFGIAILSQTVHTASSTSGGKNAGTVYYMAPEMFNGKPVKASDQYSLAIMAYEWLCGERPFFEGNFIQIGFQHSTLPVPPLRQYVPTLPIRVEEVILKALSKKPEDRFPSVLAFVQALEDANKQEDVLLKTSYTIISSPEISSSHPYASTTPLPTSSRSPDDLKDFFITYHNADRFWAEWIAWHLENANYTVIFPAWDFHVLTDFKLETQKALAAAKYIIAVLSPDYLALRKNQEARTTFFHADMINERKRLIPIQVRECGSRLQKFVGSMIYIDIAGYDKESALTILLDHIQAAIHGKPIRPTSPPFFPGSEKASQTKPPFPFSQRSDHTTFIQSALTILLDHIQATIYGKPIRPTSPPFFPGSEKTSQPEPPFPFSQRSNSTTFIEREIKLIEAAFQKKNWSEVIIKTSALIGQNTTTLPPQIYHMQGQAFFEVSENERACNALEMALTLAVDKKQRLQLLHDYTIVLAALGRWREILIHTNEALQLAPDDPNWRAYQQQANTHISDLRTQQSTPQPAPQEEKRIEVFFSYSHEDETLRSELEKYLSNLKRQRSFVGWHDGEIGAGNEWDQEIKEHINKADIILLLVSQDFIASDYCYKEEMTRALERHKAGQARVIPIILRPSDWKVTPIGELQALPTHAKPITTWANHDEAFLDTVRGIQRAIERLTKGK